MDDNSLPLSGLRVIELGIIVSAPTAGLILADLGADVIKIENTDKGDPNRENTGFPGTGQFDFLNRNKRSIAVNLKHPQGKRVFLNLAKQADVIIENLGPGTVTRLGIDYTDVLKVNPKIIYCSIKGFGSGPYSDRKMTDYPAQAESGLAYMTGLKNRPMRAGASVLDMMAASYAVIAILSRLYRRSLGGSEGPERITVGLFETGSFLVAPVISKFFQDHKVPIPLNETPFRWAVYDFIPVSSESMVFVGIINERQWESFCKAFRIENLRHDPRFVTNQERLRNRDVLLKLIEGVFSQYTIDEILERLKEADVLYARLNRPDELLNHPQLKGKLLEYASCYNSTMNVRLPPFPVESSEYSIRARKRAPRLGEHSREILRSIGYTEKEVEQMVQSGVILCDDT